MAFNPPIPMVDLKTQHGRIRSELDKALLASAHAGRFINGPEVAVFAAELADYLQVEHVIPCANGTDALQIALMALGLKPGDEVITASFTYVATAEVIALLQLKPVLVDVHPDHFTLDVDQVAAAITSRSKAIIPVHLYGQGADMEPLMALADKHGLFVVEDNAQALGADYQFSSGIQAKLGTVGHIGCTSFFPSKNLGCMGDGGALFTRDQALADRITMIANHGQSVKYQHDVVGCNSRLDSIQAAVLQVKLKHLPAWTLARQQVADRYDVGLTGLDQVAVPARITQGSHVFHQYTIKVLDGQRNALKQCLADAGIPSMIYYPIPLHKQKAYASVDYGAGFPISEQLSEVVLSLPMHPELDESTQHIITQTIQNFFS